MTWVGLKFDFLSPIETSYWRTPVLLLGFFDPNIIYVHICKKTVIFAQNDFCADVVDYIQDLFDF